MTIEVEHIRKQFGAFTALDDVSLKFADGELTAQPDGPSSAVSSPSATTRRTATCASARSASCSSITPCSST